MWKQKIGFNQKEGKVGLINLEVYQKLNTNQMKNQVKKIFGLDGEVVVECKNAYIGGKRYGRKASVYGYTKKRGLYV